jgi:hypothetical protein
MIKLMKMGWAEHSARVQEKRNAFKVLVGKLEEKRPLGRPRLRWENNIDVGGTRWNDVDWIHLAHDSGQRREIVNTVMNLRFHKMLRNFVNS